MTDVEPINPRHRGASHGGPSCRIVGCPHYNVWWRRLRRRVLGV